MQHHRLRISTTILHPLLGLAALAAMAGCAAIPAVNMVAGNMASSLIKPAQTAQPGTPQPDMIAALAQRLGITLPPTPIQAAPATTGDAVLPATTTTAAK